VSRFDDQEHRLGLRAKRAIVTAGRLDGMTAIVTGATGGIGSEIARRFAAEGARVVVTGRNPERGNAVARQITEAGGTALFVPADVGDDDDVRDLVAATLSSYGSLHLLVNNAGPVTTYSMGDFFGPDSRAFELMMRVGVFSAYYCCRHAIPHMRAAGVGSIVNVSSTGGVAASPGMMPYGVAKAALNQLARYIAVDFGRLGIRCNTIVAGLIESKPSIAEMLARPGVDEAFRTITAARRYGTPSDIASAAVFLCSDEAEYINGAQLAVDGGITARLPIPPLWDSPQIGDV
jgi:NAD(P)-dependent dehydrogenase (short-subunit alcohol dehydrogenase family)